MSKNLPKNNPKLINDSLSKITSIKPTPKPGKGGNSGQQPTLKK